MTLKGKLKKLICESENTTPSILFVATISELCFLSVSILSDSVTELAASSVLIFDEIDSFTEEVANFKAFFSISAFSILSNI